MSFFGSKVASFDLFRVQYDTQLFSTFKSTGCGENTKASYPDCYNCQCHLWSVLVSSVNKLCSYVSYPQTRLWKCDVRCLYHNDHGQFCHQPVYLCSFESAIQEKDQGDDDLHCDLRWSQLQTVSQKEIQKNGVTI